MKKIILSLLLITLFSCKKAEDKAIEKTSNPIENLHVGTHCFLFDANKDTTIVTVNIDAKNKVLGNMHWNPFQKDGALGTLTGTIKGDTINVMFDYMIEGSPQKEEKLFVIKTNELQELNGELEDKNGVLVLKPNKKLDIKTTLKPTDCNNNKF
jgi:hypothetical protein